MNPRKNATFQLIKIYQNLNSQSGVTLQPSQVDIEDFLSDDDDDAQIEILLLASLKQSACRIKNYVEEVVVSYNATEFQQHFRMSRNAFQYLLRKYESYCSTINNFKYPVKKQLLAVIWLLSTPDSYRSVGERFDFAKSSLNVIFFRVVDFLNRIAHTIITFPNETEKAKTKAYFARKQKLNGIVGAVDGCYIPIEAPKEQRIAYTNRKCFTSVTLQAICQHELKFINCFIGYPSSVHDNRIFRNSPFFMAVSQDEQNFFTQTERILGDKAYPVKTWCIPPFIDRGRMGLKQKYFNTKHASCRQIIERSFALLFGRFRRLQKLPMKGVTFVPQTILAACVLHNICIDFPDENMDQYITEGMAIARRNIPTENEISRDEADSTSSGIITRNCMMEDLWETR